MNSGVAYLDLKRLSVWLESWEGRLCVTDVSNHPDDLFQSRYHLKSEYCKNQTNVDLLSSFLTLWIWYLKTIIYHIILLPYCWLHADMYRVISNNKLKSHLHHFHSPGCLQIYPNLIWSSQCTALPLLQELTSPWCLVHHLSIASNAESGWWMTTSGP